jgi:hypothetical protein
MDNTRLEISSLHEVRENLLQHPIYKKLHTPEHIRIFMKHHVFAVWDFMSLLKKLQQELTSVSVPWMPNHPAPYARFINEIVLGEETDEDSNGSYISHFELYLKAMEEVGADATLLHSFVDQLRAGVSWDHALAKLEISPTIKQFVRNTMNIALHGKPHEAAAAFFYGREEIIPDMFGVLVHELEVSGASAHWLKYYLHRHIELDGDDHGPLAEKLLIYLCDGKADRIADVERVAKQALHARIELWNGVIQEIEHSQVHATSR